MYKNKFKLIFVNTLVLIITFYITSAGTANAQIISSSSSPEAEQEYEYTDALWEEFLNSNTSDTDTSLDDQDGEWTYYYVSTENNNIINNSSSSISTSTDNVINTKDIKPKLSTSTSKFKLINLNISPSSTTNKIEKKAKKSNTTRVSLYNINAKSPQKDIINLQKFLVSKGYLKMPKNTKYGKFGPLTKKALAKYKNSVNY